MTLILGIESSCDETAAAVVQDGERILSNVVVSQIEIHREFGGVVPELASRKHIESISLVIEEALRQAGIRPAHGPAQMFAGDLDLSLRHMAR